MALKFRRGTTAQQSGSLAFGEPYVNTTLGTLLIGGPNGDIVLSTTGTGSTGTFGAISGSGLDITGNANIAGNLTLGGNITIGNATTDNVVINADLSSSLIPNDDNAFDIGSTSKRYKNLYANNISASVVEIVSGSGAELRLINTTLGYGYHLQNTVGGNFSIHNSETNSSIFRIDSGSIQHAHLFGDLFVSGNISAGVSMISQGFTGSLSGSVNGIGNVSAYSSSVASKFGTLATTGSNTFRGNQTIIGSGAGFAAYISTSVNDATLGLDTTANVNALYFLKDTEKNFELSYDTTNVNGIFRLLPYDSNSFFEIGNPSNSGEDYIFVSEPTYGNVLLGPGIGNGVTSLNGSIPATDKVQIAGNLYVSGAIKANSFTGSIAATNGVVSGSSQVTLQSTTGFSSFDSALATITGSLITSASTAKSTNDTQDGRLTSLESFSGSQLTQNTALATISGSLIVSASTAKTTNDTQDGRLTNIESFSGSTLTRLTALEVETSNLETTSASVNISVANLNTTSASLLQRVAANEAVSGTFARTNSTNTFNGNQTISGSLTVTQDLVILGSSSIQNVSSSTLNIGTNLITVAVNQPSVRFGGIAVIDSGSAGASGSLLYDSVQDEFIFVHKGNGTNVTSSHFILGPETFDNLGNENYLTNNRVPKGTGKEHLNDSQISDDGTTVTIPGALTVTGNITGPIRATNGVVSGSSQITYASISSIPAGIVSGSSQITSILPAGVVSGSSQVVGSSITTNTITIGSTSTALGGTSTTLAGLTSVSSTGFTGALTGNASTATTLQTARTINGTSFNGSADITIPNLVSGSSQITAGSTTGFATAVKTQLDANTVVSGSSQITAGSTTGFATAVKTQLNTNTVVSSSAQIAFSGVTGTVSNAQLANSTISGKSLGTNLDTLTIGTGLSGTSYNGTGPVTIANTGVTSITAGTGISRDVSTGGVTITNTGVTSNVAGTGVTVSGATGAVTISIGQSVATSASPTFAGLTINGAITATGDITAFFTSDKRHKNTIQNIPNALDKVSKLNGVTWEWNEDVNEVTKSTPKTGLIAQEVQEVLPEVVREREDGFLSLDYSKMVGLLVEAIKEQQSQIEELKSKLGYN